MSVASKTSNARRARKTSGERMANSFASSKSRGRKREARRWLDVLAARCTNGARNPNPLTIPESARLHEQAFADLEKRDKTLSDAVHQCTWDRMLAEDGITLDEWRRRALKSADRIARIRATLR
jgi:hypothetical protein